MKLFGYGNVVIEWAEFVCNNVVNCFFMFPYKKHVDLMLGGGSELSVLVTMCGKSVDLLWLCSRGHSVTGVELSSIAVEQLFQESSIPHTVEGECCSDLASS